MDDARLEELARAIESSPHNLMSQAGLEVLRSRHLPECRAVAQGLPEGPARLVDVGSGGGLPGLVIALLRDDLSVTLVESIKKKAAFLRETAAALGLDVEVRAERAEDLVGVVEPFDLATARAVAPLDRLLPLVLPLLRPGGRLYAIKGARWPEELLDAEPVLREMGAYVAAVPEPSASPERPKVLVIESHRPRERAS